MLDDEFNKRFQYDEAFSALSKQRIQGLLESEEFANLEEKSTVAQTLYSLFYASDFCTRVATRYPNYVHYLLTSDSLEKEKKYEDYYLSLKQETSVIKSFEDLSQCLREFRNQQMLRITWRDQIKNADVFSILRELSALAYTCITFALEILTDWASEKFGVPKNDDGSQMHLVVLAMGKLGANELNFSSDIDLIFCYANDGEVLVGEKSKTHSEYFVHLSQQLVRLLSENTAFGFVYRVDTRLRPFGNSGRLALSFAAMESYYERHGREWERYALIKANPVSLDENANREILSMLNPFIYRRYLDFSAYGSLREMKQMIDQEVSKKGLQTNVKLGAGGIREIEFIGQAFQLIRGGRTRQLQQRGIDAVLNALKSLELMPEFVCASLLKAYVFLRKVENAIQEYDDQQQHHLPSKSLEQSRLVFALRFESWESFTKTLSEHMENVHEHFDQIFSAPQLESTEGKQKGQNSGFNEIWLGYVEGNQAQQILEEAGYNSPVDTLMKIMRLRDSSVYRNMGPNGKHRLDTLMPLLLSLVAKSRDPNTCLLRVFRFIEAIAKRTAYIALLTEHPVSLSQLVQLFDKSPWIVDLIVSHPLLLDELIDPRRLYEPVDQNGLTQELEVQLQTNKDDIEFQMLKLAEFKQTNVLRVAASELTNAMPVEKISDQLTDIAEIIVANVTELAMSHLINRHGRPQFELDGKTQNAEFCVIAYGKLGGMELGFGSDLDLVFLHNSIGQRQQTQGDKSLDNATYFIRLGQRIIHYLNTASQGGNLYEVDMRLRPSGASGLLVSSIKGFEDYQFSKAWTWEHQALIRARCIYGNEHMKDAFTQIRKQVLCQKRDGEALQKEVNDMRVKMRKESKNSKPGEFDIKNDIGGIQDIEFIIQYLVLLWAQQYQDLVEYTDNLRLLEGLVKNGLLKKEKAKSLSQAYLHYRHAVHKCVLQRKNAVIVSNAQLEEHRQNVKDIWVEFVSPK